MNSVEGVRTALVTVASELELLEVQEHADGTWTVYQEEMVFVDLELTPTAEILSFNSELKAPEHRNREFVNRLFAYANAQWRETGGLRFSILPDGNEIEDTYQISLHVPTALLTAQSLKVRLQHFFDASTHWNAALAAGPEITDLKSRELEPNGPMLRA